MDNGCPQCEKRTRELYTKWKKLTQEKRGSEILDESILCIDCQIEQADADLTRAKNRLEELKKEKEQNEFSDSKS